MAISAGNLRLLRFFAPALVSFFPLQALADNDFSVGVEGFEDVYKEPTATVDTHSKYESVDANYTHISDDFFTAIDGRYSSGTSDYKSDSGILNGDDEIETDTRLRTGAVMQAWHGLVMPYIGVGWRYYFDEGKGHETNLGAFAYDRHINQLYLPVGATYKYTSSDGWTFSPTVELGPLLYGWVESHLDPTVSNYQKKGFETRADFMVGQQYKYFGWEAGPFVRYWHMQDSHCTRPDDVVLPPGECLEEPKNTRLQSGAELRLNF